MANSGNEIEEHLKNRMNFAKKIEIKYREFAEVKRDLGLKSKIALIP